uniref:PiggyBac transposable element-derived protein 4 n=1 Tax=Strongyloides stercoralis TaxID=6248 RepID=A0A0K0E1W0_STRER
MSDSDESDLDDYFPSSSGSETSEYDTTSDEEDSDCDYSLKDARRWVRLDIKNLPMPPPRFPFLGQPGIKKNILDASNSLLFFELFFDEQLVLHIVTETNRFADQYINQHPGKEKSRTKFWHPTNTKEIYIFLGILILQGITIKPDISLYWSKNKLIETPIFGKLMSRNRFQLIMKFLHFSDNSTFDENSHPNPKLRKIWPVFFDLMKKFSSVYTPERDLSIDESLMLFKGKLSWVQYIPLKRARFGVKLFVLAEAESDYIHNTIIYTGKSTIFDKKYENYGVATKSVMTLIEPFLGKGYCVIADNFYLSPELADVLIQHNTDVYGTLRPNRRDLPENFNKITLKKGEIAAFQRGKITVLRWRDKKYVSLLSSIHTANCSETDKKVIKPAIVMNYNLTMGGVDKADQALVCYPTTRKRQKRYYVTIFRHLLDIAIWNAFILRKKQLPNIDNYDFRMNLVERIIEKFHVTAPRSAKRQKLQSDCPLRLTARHFPDLVPSTSSKKNASRKCIVCSKTKVRRETRYQCNECDVGLCVQPCFRKYHTADKF